MMEKPADDGFTRKTAVRPRCFADTPGCPEAAADSYTGRVRRRNEDSFLYAYDRSGRRLLAAVADGIGGTCNGDVAGSFSLRMLEQKWRSFVIPESNREEIVRHFLLDAAADLNERIHAVNNLPGGSGCMGTTLAAAVFLEDFAVGINAGDSRMYCIRNGRIVQLSRDHHLAGELVRRGKISPRDAARIPGSNMLTQAIGPNRTVEPYCVAADLHSGDQFLLCTDGLTAHVSDAEILETAMRESSASAVVKSLCHLTFRRGARDNTTVIFVRIP